MKTKELRVKSEEELQKLLQERRGELRQLRFKVVRKEAKDTSEVRKIKRDIARVLSILHEEGSKKTS